MIQTTAVPLPLTQNIVAETVAVKLPLALNLELGQLLLARVGQAQENGRGYFLLPDGNRLTFTGGQALTEGEMVRLQVSRLTPDVAVRVLASESGAASSLARSAEQSLTRAPELFRRLLDLAGVSPRGSSAASAPQSAAPSSTPLPPSTSAPASPPLSPQGVASLLNAATQGNTAPASPAQLLSALSGRPVPPSGGLTSGGLASSTAASFVTGKGESLLDVVKSALPTISAEALMRGDVGELAKVFQGDVRRPPGETVRMLRQAAAQLQVEEGGDDPAASRASGRSGEADASLGAARSALNRLADLVAAQEVLPRGQPLPDGGLLLGYRAFWLPEGGFGEAFWKQEGDGRGGRGEDGEAKFTTVMIALEMTRLGPIQARLTHGENQLQVGIAAADEEALAALRGHIGELRRGLHEQGLPLRSLDLTRLSLAEMQAGRTAALGLGSGFVTEA